MHGPYFWVEHAILDLTTLTEVRDDPDLASQANGVEKRISVSFDMSSAVRNRQRRYRISTDIFHPPQAKEYSA